MKTKVRDLVGPTPAQLRAIDAEWPLIAAELAVVDAEIAMVRDEAGPAPLDRRRLRRAEHRVLAEKRAAAQVVATRSTRPAVA